MNRRRFARARAQLRFTFGWGSQFELYMTENLSASGAALVRHDAHGAMPPMNVEGECAFTVDGQEIRTPARVVRVDGDRFAVRFIAIPRVLEDRIVSWVLRVEAQALSRRIRV